jgi:putative transposase
LRELSLHSPPDGFDVHLNLAGRLKLNGPNQLWLADITYVRLKLEFVFLAVLLDAYSRRVVGWNLASTLTTRLPLAALNQAINERQPPRGVVHHSDQGVPYTPRDYREVLRQHGMFASISRPGTPLDNARCESFMRTLKREEIGARSFSTLEEVRRNIEKFIERYYNVQRLHSALGYRAPVEFETAEGPAVDARGTSAVLVT